MEGYSYRSQEFFRFFYQKEEEEHQIRKVQENEWDNKLKGNDFFITLWDNEKGMLDLSKGKGKYISYFYCWINSGRFHQLWWIAFRPTIYNILHDFQQMKRIYDENVHTLISITRLVMEVSGRHYIFYVRLHYHFAKKWE